MKSKSNGDYGEEKCIESQRMVVQSLRDAHNLG